MDHSWLNYSDNCCRKHVDSCRHGSMNTAHEDSCVAISRCLEWYNQLSLHIPLSGHNAGDTTVNVGHEIMHASNCRSFELFETACRCEMR